MMQLPTFEEGFLQDEIVDVESAGESGVVVRKADIARFLQRQELFHLRKKMVTQVMHYPPPFKTGWGVGSLRRCNIILEG